MLRQCTNCGAAVEVDDAVLSATCRFCDSPLVDGARAAEVVDGVVPFTVPKARARDAIVRWLAGLWFVPTALQRASRADELGAVFVPAYAHEALCRSRWTARIGLHWTRTETYTTVENGKTVTKTRQVTETEWFPTSGTHAVVWHDHLVSASQGLSEAESNALEPFDLGQAVPFAPEVVAGVAAEQPTRTHAEVDAVAHDELLGRARDAVARLLPGDRSSGLSVQTDVDVQGVRLVLLPVWIAAVTAGGHTVRVLVNGQTGEVVGQVPTDWGKVVVAVGAA
ncbi:MAG: hypothetical protein KC656_27550, partial [Myxococcales bacterium]|nr:hypothetical protein [Myxococcales bacterium]